MTVKSWTPLKIYPHSCIWHVAYASMMSIPDGFWKAEFFCVWYAAYASTIYSLGCINLSF
jgi:hypothetical protein